MISIHSHRFIYTFQANGWLTLHILNCFNESIYIYPYFIQVIYSHKHNCWGPSHIRGQRIMSLVWYWFVLCGISPMLRHFFLWSENIFFIRFLWADTAILCITAHWQHGITHRAQISWLALSRLELPTAHAIKSMLLILTRPAILNNAPPPPFIKSTLK